MKIIEINLVKLSKNKLNINEYLTIHKIAKNITGEEFPFSSEQKHLDSLEENEWIHQDDNSVNLTKKAELLIGFNESKVTSDNFDELFDLYPHRTPSGRILRSRNKTVSGVLTKNYLVSKKKYLTKVSNLKLHNLILEATKKMSSQARMRGGMEYIQQLEVYINQNSWEKYMEDDNETFKSDSNTIRI